MDETNKVLAGFIPFIGFTFVYLIGVNMPSDGGKVLAPIIFGMFILYSIIFILCSVLYYHLIQVVNTTSMKLLTAIPIYFIIFFFVFFSYPATKSFDVAEIPSLIAKGIDEFENLQVKNIFKSDTDIYTKKNIQRKYKLYPYFYDVEIQDTTYKIICKYEFVTDGKTLYTNQKGLEYSLDYSNVAIQQNLGYGMQEKNIIFYNVPLQGNKRYSMININNYKVAIEHKKITRIDFGFLDFISYIVSKFG